MTELWLWALRRTAIRDQVKANRSGSTESFLVGSISATNAIAALKRENVGADRKSGKESTGGLRGGSSVSEAKTGGFGGATSGTGSGASGGFGTGGSKGMIPI